jgi:hypothetical protein
MLKKRHTNFNLTGNFERHIMAKQDNKTFTVAGTATNPDGTTKARFANDLVARIKILNKANCTNINLMELPSPMTKLEALEYLQNTGTFTGDASYAIANRTADKMKSARKTEVSVTLKTGGKPAKKVTAQDVLSAVDLHNADPV